MTTEFEALRAKHHAHLAEATARGEKGRACTPPPVTSADILKYSALIADDTPASAAEALHRLFGIINGDVGRTLPDKDYIEWVGPVVFEKLTGDLRNAAFHCLWHVIELTLGRDPSK